MYAYLSTLISFCMLLCFPRVCDGTDYSHTVSVKLFSFFREREIVFKKLYINDDTLKNENPTKSPRFPPMLLMNDDKEINFEVVETLMSVVE